ncbi:MAG: hypothetical protein JW891_18375 [Candidatus Lokiarchaeota archaeon]|nr:hypothetical protein [Candidatus Lokiarchaeota archaeon]
MFFKVSQTRTELCEITMHVDYDKIEKIFYMNIYFPSCNYVLKTHLASIDKNSNKRDVKIEKFDLTKYSYLLLI